jgi:hypothetical protein
MPRLLRRLALPLLALAGLVVIVVAGFLARTGSDPVAEVGIEAIFPTDGANVVAQDTVGVDLAADYAGELTLNGQLLPASQLDPDNGLNQLVFRPGPGKVLTELKPGKNCASVTYWRLEDGRPSAGTPLDWCFQVV